MRRDVYFVLRLARAGCLLLLGLTLVFGIIHFGPTAPADATAGSPEATADLEEKKEKFGLTRPLPIQYGDYLRDMVALDFGTTWTNRHVAISEDQQVNEVDRIVWHRLQRTGWLWLWTGAFVLAFTVPLAGIGRLTRGPSFSDRGDVVQATPVFVLALLLETFFFNLQKILFGLDWRQFLVPTPESITRPLPVADMGTLDDVLLASKLAIPPALALALPISAVALQRWAASADRTAEATFIDSARGKGLSTALVELKHVVPAATLPLVVLVGELFVVLIGGTILVELVFNLQGMGALFHNSVVRNDYTTLQATMFVFLVLVLGLVLLADAVYLLAGGRPDGRSRRRPFWTEGWSRVRRAAWNSHRERLRPLDRARSVHASVRADPRSAYLWLAGAALLVVVELGALVQLVGGLLFGSGAFTWVPTLLDPDVVSNTGYQTAAGTWRGTFLGLPPALAWGVRVGLVYLYAAAWGVWLLVGLRIYRTEYRPVDRTRLDAALERLCSHRWGVAGIVVLTMFVVAAIFAPAVAPTSLDRTVSHTSLDGTSPDVRGDAPVRYYDAEASAVRTTSVSDANLNSASNSLSSVGLGSYDEYGRFHPLGTSREGTDLLAEMLHGLRLYLGVALGAVLLAVLLTVIADGVGVVVDRTVDGGVAFAADFVALLPTLPLVFMASRMFYPSLDSIRTQLLVWTVLFGLFGWARLWRSLDPVVAQIRDSDWVDGDRAIGQDRLVTQLRVLRAGAGSILVYGLLGAAGVIVSTAALSYLSHVATTSPFGVYEWGTLLWFGNGFILTPAGHLFVVPAVALVLLVGSVKAAAAGVRAAFDDGTRSDSCVPGDVGNLGGGG